MPPKKSAAPPPQSDESDEDFDEPAAKKQNRKGSTKHVNAEDIDVRKAFAATLAKPTTNIHDSSEEDEDEDLLNAELPPKPKIFAENLNSVDRLMITKIDVTNFKSYYGSTTIGPFHKNFTSIIGPNGSGKSNVIDSLLFVFGFRNKQIRSKQVSNLIHKSQGKECDSCTVSIHFQRIVDIDSDRYNVIPNSQFYISRTARKNNSSTYSMNGKTASLKEVEAKLKEVEVDLSHNRFLILQGEVEAISMMKCMGVNKGEEGMLEYLEDIIGTNRYLKPIMKLERRLDRLTVQLSQQKIRRENARASKIGLEASVRDAVEYLKLENELATMKSKLGQRRKRKYVLQLEPLQEELEAKKEEMKSIGGKLDNNKQGAKDSEKQEKELSKQKSATEAEFDKLKQKIEDDATEEKKRKQNIKRIRGDLDKMTVEVDKEKKKKETLVEAPEKAAKKIEKLKVESENLMEIEKTARAEADKNLAEFDRRSEDYIAEKTEANKEYAVVNEKFNDVKGRALVAEAELSDLRKIADKGKNTLNDLRMKLDEAEKKYEQESVELDEVERELPEQQQLLNEATKEGPAAKAKENQLDREMRDVRGRMDEITNEQKRAATGNKALEALMREKDSGRIPGFIGRLGDLGAIDAKYDKAISTNCGFLQAYVCETAEDSAKCIDFLSANRLGRQNFISINKLEDRKKYMNVPADRFPAPRLFDLVKCEEYARTAFYFALSDVMVVNDLGEAQKLDRQYKYRYNFVTLNGDKLSSDGTITGGGVPRQGLIGTELKVRRQSSNDNREQMGKLEEKLEKIRREHAEASDIARKFDRQMFDARQNCNVLTSRMKALKASIENLTPKIETLKKTISTQEKEAAQTNVDVKEIEEKQIIVDRLIKERDDAAEKAGNAKRRVDEIVSKIDAIFNELVECHKSEAKDAEDKRKAIEKTIAKETGAINNSERNIAKVDERIAQLEKDIGKKQSELEKLEENVVDDEKMEEQKTKLKELEELMKEFDGKFKEMRDLKNSLSKEEMELEKTFKETSEKVAGLKLTISDKKKKVEEIQENISKLRLNKIPRLAFLSVQARPEDMRMVLEDDADFDRLIDLPQDELYKVQKKAASEYADQMYTMEYEMRNKAANEPEMIEEMLDATDAVPILTDEELERLDDDQIEEMQFRKKTYEQKVEALKGKVNLSIIGEYIVKVKKYNEETNMLNDKTANFTAHRVRALFVKKCRFEEFHECFTRLVHSVREVYQMLTLGGDANLVYKSGIDPFSEGIQFLVRPNKKAWKNIENLSGGEKTLSSLSLVFALHAFRPTPFYVMDEIDAALDYRNVSIIAHYVKERTRNAQFIIISLRNNMFELANRLVGIYKVDDCTQNVSIDPITICQIAKRTVAPFGANPIVMPDEVSQEFHRKKNELRMEQAAREKQYENFPSTSDLTRAERIVGIESKVRKVISRKSDRAESTADPTRVASSASTQASGTNRPQSRASSRADSRIVNMFNLPQARLVRANDENITRPLSDTSRPNSETTDSEQVLVPPAAKRRTSDLSASFDEAAEKVVVVVGENIEGVEDENGDVTITE